MKCQAETRRGSQCRNQALPDSELCRVHAAAASNGDAHAARSATASAAVTAAATYAEQVATSQPRRAAGEFNEAKPDPFHAIAEAMRRAAEEMQAAEATDASANDESSDEQTGLLRKAVYSTSYCLGYGLAFPTFLVLGLAPMNNPFGRGLLDGADSAKESLRRRAERRAANKAADQHTSGSPPQPDVG